MAPELFAEEILKCGKYINRRCTLNGNGEFHPKSEPPTGFSSHTLLFDPKVERKILFVLDFIGSIQSQGLCDLFRLVFASVMVGMSSCSYEAG